MLLSQRLSELLKQRVFSFASNDDILQVTCTCDSGKIVRIHHDLELLDMVCEDGRLVFRPVFMEEDSDIAVPDDLLAALSRLEDAEILDTLNVEGGGRPMHQIVLDDWPGEAGDPRDHNVTDSLPDLEFDFEEIARSPGISAASVDASRHRALERVDTGEGWFERLLNWLASRTPGPSEPEPKPRPLTSEQIAASSLESAHRKLGFVSEFEEKGDLNHVVFLINSACEFFLEHTLHACDSPEEAVNVLKRKNVPELLRRVLDVSAKVDADRRKKNLPMGGPVSGTPDVDIHLAWLLGDHDAAQELLKRCHEPDRECMCGPDWWLTEYLRVLRLFAAKAPVEPDLDRLKQIPKFVPACAMLMADIAAGRPTEESLSNVDEQWGKLNGNDRAEWFPVDGACVRPVKWNFRKASILSYAKSVYGLSPSAETKEQNDA